MIKQLQTLYLQSCFACFYTNKSSTTSFIFGRILGINDYQTAIYMISPEGNYDGIIVINIESIYRIEWGDLYSQKMSEIINVDNLPSKDIKFDETDFFKTILNYSMNLEEVVSIEVLKSGYDDLIGFVDNVEDLFCTIRQISREGLPDGYSIINLADISRVCCESDDEVQLKIIVDK